MKGCSFSKGLTCLLFCLAIAAPGNTTITVSVFNGSKGVPVQGQQVALTMYAENSETVVTANTDSYGSIELSDPVLGSAQALGVTTEYKGHSFYFRSLLNSSSDNVTVNVYEPEYCPENIHISTLHTVVSPAKNKLIFDIRMAVTNTGRTCFVSGNYGFTYPLPADGTLIEASPPATRNETSVLYYDGARPSTSVFSLRYSVPYAYNEPYRYVVPDSYPVSSMLFVGDPVVDVMSDHPTAKRSIKTVADRIGVPYLTLADLTGDGTVIIIPIGRSRNYYMAETATGLAIALAVLLWYRRKKKTVPAYANLVESISNRERYDRELHKQ